MALRCAVRHINTLACQEEKSSPDICVKFLVDQLKEFRLFVCIKLLVDQSRNLDWMSLFNMKCQQVVKSSI